ncbi:MAG: galactokinase, partial [Pseudomonadota bacterium]
MRELLDSVWEAFEQTFGASPSLTAQAPGRVNLLGEHTDYNDGFVLPCAINFHTVVAARSRSDSIVKVLALDCEGQMDEFDLSKPIEFHQHQGWSNYVRGSLSYLQNAGFSFGGAELVVSGSVPQGGGLGSSAALEVAIIRTLDELYGLNVDGVAVAKISQAAENEFVGCNCGIMDQMISVLGEKGCALLIDCRSLESRAVSMPDDVAILVINSNKKHSHVDGEYNIRRAQCEEAANFFGVPALRDVTVAQLDRAYSEMDEVIARRARHIVTENDRTVRAAQALSDGDMPLISQLMRESHLSMRDDFEITIKEIDVLFEIVDSVVGDKGGVRMTGGGFGG